MPDKGDEQASVHVLSIVGARPNFVKIAPLLSAFKNEPWIRSTLAHTGQHRDDRMSGRFFQDLGLPAPDYQLVASGASRIERTAAIMSQLEAVFMKEDPWAVLVAGDVDSALAGALAAKQSGRFLIHVEAGLRSFDRSMPEEINRVAIDAISDLYLVSEESGVRNLLREGAPAERIFHVGNLMIDSLLRHLPEAKSSDILDRLGLRGEPFGLITLHRAGNVDQADALNDIVRALRRISDDIRLVFPVHPRTRPQLSDRDLGARILLCEPLGYLEFLALMSESTMVLTDSGGVQEESTALGVPCLTLRNNTERPITVERGTNRLAGSSYDAIISAWAGLRNNPPRGVVPKLWDGNAASRCVEAIRSVYTPSRLGG